AGGGAPVDNVVAWAHNPFGAAAEGGRLCGAAVPRLPADAAIVGRPVEHRLANIANDVDGAAVGHPRDHRRRPRRWGWLLPEHGDVRALGRPLHLDLRGDAVDEDGASLTARTAQLEPIPRAPW